jgi:hypothetical protein
MTQSLDMLGDFIKAYEYLKAHLSAAQYQKLTIVLLQDITNQQGILKVN